MNKLIKILMIVVASSDCIFRDHDGRKWLAGIFGPVWDLSQKIQKIK